MSGRILGQAVPQAALPTDPSEAVAAQAAGETFESPERSPAFLPEVVVYDQPQFEGREWRTNLSWRALGEEWQGRIASLIVVSGEWAIFSEPDYAGARQDLKPGYYPEMSRIEGMKTTIGSFAFVEDPSSELGADAGSS